MIFLITVAASVCIITGCAGTVSTNQVVETPITQSIFNEKEFNQNSVFDGFIYSLDEVVHYIDENKEDLKNLSEEEMRQTLSTEFVTIFVKQLETIPEEKRNDVFWLIYNRLTTGEWVEATSAALVIFTDTITEYINMIFEDRDENLNEYRLEYIKLMFEGASYGINWVRNYLELFPLIKSTSLGEATMFMAKAAQYVYVKIKEKTTDDFDFDSYAYDYHFGFYIVATDMYRFFDNISDIYEELLKDSQKDCPEFYEKLLLIKDKVEIFVSVNPIEMKEDIEPVTISEIADIFAKYLDFVGNIVINYTRKQEGENLATVLRNINLFYKIYGEEYVKELALYFLNYIDVFFYNLDQINMRVLDHIFDNYIDKSLLAYEAGFMFKVASILINNGLTPFCKSMVEFIQNFDVTLVELMTQLGDTFLEVLDYLFPNF